MNTAASPLNVLIIGAGPVGLTLACELARHGVPGVRLVEKRAGRTAHSNALIVHVRTQEGLTRWAHTRPLPSWAFLWQKASSARSASESVRSGWTATIVPIPRR